MPRSRIAASAPNTTSTTVGASPSDGSSSSRTSGSATRARAIASCCCWPPESAPAWRVAELLDDRKELVDAREDGGDATACAPRCEAEAEVLLDGQLREDAPALGYERDAAARDLLGRPADQRRAAEPDVAAYDRGDAHDRVQRRRLAGAVRADQTDDLAGTDLEREAAYGFDAAVANAQIGDGESHSSGTGVSPR